jgi:hypothetical protein
VIEFHLILTVWSADQYDGIGGSWCASIPFGAVGFTHPQQILNVGEPLSGSEMPVLSSR